MFGAIVPQVCELKVRELKTYQAYYCGLCKVLKERYHRQSVLYYDCVFLFLLSDSLAHEAGEAAPCKCILHPFEKRIALRGRGAEYAADINILMAYAKADDDAHDTGKGGFRRHYLRKAFATVERTHPGLLREAQDMKEMLHTLEAQRSPDTDALAHTYAQLLGSVFENVDVLHSHILRDLGYNLGRWTYLLDALEDFDEDAKSGAFNVFAHKYGAMTGETKREIERSLYFSLAQAANALERLPIQHNKEILQNIVYLGLKARTMQALSGEKPQQQDIGGMRIG